MSFGGSVLAMITSLKNNKRSRTSMFEKEILENKGNYGDFIDHKKMSPQELQKFRAALVAKRQKEQKKLLIIFTSIMVIVVAVVVYFLFFD